MLRWVPSLQSSQYRVGVNGRAPENLVAKSVREGIQDRSAAAPDRWLTYASSPHRCFRICNIERLPMHVYGDIQDRRRLIVVEPLGDHHAIMWIEYPFLADRMADAENRPS